MNKIILFSILLLSSSLVQAQLDKEAKANYEKSQYEAISSDIEGDAVVIYDRTYIRLVDVSYEEVHMYKTIHRKIKINSLYGLEQFNKLYIPTYSDLTFKSEVFNCQAKVLRNGVAPITIDTSHMVKTTLPANVPYLYKVDGDVQMLALHDLSIGDEIEYLYTTKSFYQIPPVYFYKSDRVGFSSSNFCIEKSIIIEGEDYIISTHPYNFKESLSKTTEYLDGVRVSLKNIKRESNNLYVNDNLDQPFLFYYITQYEDEVDPENWESFASDFKPKRRETRQNYVFNGEDFDETLKGIDTVQTKKGKFEYILQRINSPLEESFQFYEDVKNDIDLALSYAKAISNLLEKKELAANFHFVVDKELGQLDKLNVSLFQFDNIIISFLDDDNTIHYFSLLEPYSQLDEIQWEFKNTETYSIHQDEDGKRTFSFGKIPAFEAKNNFNKEVSIDVKSLSENKINYLIKEKVEFEGDIWLSLKPYIINISKDTVNKTERLESFIENFLIASDYEDTLVAMTYSISPNSFQISYEYELQQNVLTEAKIINLKIDDFLENDFYTPYNLRENRDFPGYIYDYNLNFKINFNLDNKLFWIENTLLKTDFDNNIASIKTDYTVDASKVLLEFKMDYIKDQFQIEEWGDVVKMRDEAFNFLNSNLYFKKK